MTVFTIIPWLVVIVVFALTLKPLGIYIARVFEGQPTLLDRPLGPIERALFRVTGVSPDASMNARTYSFAFLITGLIWVVLSYIELRIQNHLPLNPMHFGPVSPLVAFNTAASFTTNTNWQAYSGESTMSTLSQFANLGYLQWVTPAMGLAMFVAFTRTLAGKPMGNFFSDLTLACTRILLPLGFVLTLLLVWQGVPETLGNYLHLHTLVGQTQVVPRGPIASWEAIEHLGTNGGGYTNANSSNPLENPTAFSNILETIAMGILPVASFYAFGVMTKKRRLSWVLIAVAGTIFIGMLLLLYFPEASGNPIVNAMGLSGHNNWVGKELRFGMGGTSIFETSTMAFTTGSIASAHDSFLPLSSLTFFIGMFLNMVFGGKGVGLLNMLMVVILAVFLIGLMVGRTPEFLGKKIEAKEVSLAALAFMIHPMLILGGTALATHTAMGQSSILNPGPHGLSEILYGFASGAANNGSAFAGLNAATPFYTIGIGIEMLLARFPSVIAMLYIGESLLHKKAVPVTAGTLRTDTPLFAGILLAVIIIVNALTFFPVTALGPIAEHYLLLSGHLF